MKHKPEWMRFCCGVNSFDVIQSDRQKNVQKMSQHLIVRGSPSQVNLKKIIQSCWEAQMNRNQFHLLGANEIASHAMEKQKQDSSEKREQFCIW